MFITDATEQARTNERRAHRFELVNDCAMELRRASRMPGGVIVDNLQPENRAIMLGAGVRMDSASRLTRPNEYAIHQIVEYFRRDSAYASEWKEDAGEARLFETMLQHVVAALVPTLYIPNQARTLFPIDQSFPAGATTILKQRVIDEDDPGLGQMSGNADDIQLVEVSAEGDIYRLLSFARGIVWTLDELEEAAFAGVPLQQEKLNALNRAVERVFEIVALLGYETGNIVGAYKHPSIVATLPITGGWATATADQIVADIAALIEAVALANGNYRPNRLIIPQTLVRYLKVRRSNTDLNVRQMVMDDEPSLQIMECHRANLYNATDDGPRIMALVADPQFLNIGVARPFTLEPPEKHGFSYRLIGRQKLAGCIASVPLTAGYMDGC